MPSHWVPVTGLASPRPSMETLPAGRPLPTRKSATVRARASRQLQVVGIGTDAVSVTHHHGAAIFRLDVDDLLIQVLSAAPFRLQGGFAEGKQHVRAQEKFLSTMTGSGTGSGASAGASAT